MNKSADESSIEIKTTLRKLNPQNGGDHKYRVRRLNKFRNYVTDGEKGLNTPEFYDDDLLTLFAGNTHDSEKSSEGYSLLKAASEPSTDHDGVLKRSAKHAMALIKYLVCDFVDKENGTVVTTDEDTSLNAFAHAFCCLTLNQLQQCKWHLHLTTNINEQNDIRAGSKEDACELLLLLVLENKNISGNKDGQNSLKTLLPNEMAQTSFESWVREHKSTDVYRKMKSNLEVASEYLEVSTHGGETIRRDSFTFNDDETLRTEAKSLHSKMHPMSINNEHPLPMKPVERWGDSILAMKFKQKKTALSPHASKNINDDESNVTNISDLAAEAMAREAEREENRAALEKEKAQEEKQKEIGKDPLGLRGNYFDLRVIQTNRETLIQEALELFQDEEEEEIKLMKESVTNTGNGSTATPSGIQEKLLSLQAKRDSFMAMIESSASRRSKDNQKGNTEWSEMKDNEDIEENDTLNNNNHNDSIGSILPIYQNFDPLLFLSLVHGKATYDQLQDALKRLNNTADNQALRLQQIVRDNFALFVRCADGIDFFSDDLGEESTTRALAPEQLDIVEKLSDSCTFQAKKSFKPLLDNTNEVRKTQRALALLQRVSPLLQIPHQMRQNVEIGNMNAAIKAYRRILVIDEDCKIDLLKFVKTKADEAALETRDVIEKTLANASVPVSALLDAVRDLGELDELNVSEKNGDIGKKKNKKMSEEGRNQQTILHNHPPALACLLLQAHHFSRIVDNVIEHSESVTTRIYNGDSTALQDDFETTVEAKISDQDSNSIISDFSSNASDSRRKNKWRYDILEARVLSTVQGVSIAKKWLKRLLRIGVAAMDVERRHTARLGQRKPNYSQRNEDNEEVISKPMEIFVSHITPAIKSLVSHIIFCSLGCSNTNQPSKNEVKMTFGQDSAEALQMLLRTPLPPRESSVCATELAELVDIVRECSNTTESLRPTDRKTSDTPPASPKHLNSSNVRDYPLDETLSMAEEAVITIEQRRCIYTFHVCARNCGRRASGSGIFDGEALHESVQILSASLTKPVECSNELEKGCQLVVIRCCEGLVEFVRGKDTEARLKAVSECAKMLSSGIQNVVREVSSLSHGQCENVLEVMEHEISALESSLFHEFLEEVKRDVSSCVKLGYLETTPVDETEEKQDNVLGFDNKPVYEGKKNSTFPGYLSSSLLAIVRCRARVEKALGQSTIRRSQNEAYLHIAMSKASECLINKLCDAISARKVRLTGTQADMLANELQFLINILEKDLSKDVMQNAEQCCRMLCAKAGRERGIRGGGPDGLGAIEELERLGRVYVMCLGIDE